MKELHKEILKKRQNNLLSKFSNSTFWGNFFLASGTGLALRIGHRYSDDFDFFSLTDIDLMQLKLSLSEFGNFTSHLEKKNTLYGTIDEIRVSFIKYDYKLLKKPETLNGVNLCSLIDNSLMKIEAIIERGFKKDFVDIFFILKLFSLEYLIKMHSRKYGKNFQNKIQIFKSLIYFDDAEKEPMPKMKQKTEWELIKKSITSEVINLSKKYSLKI